MLQEFKAFAMKGNVVDLAVAVVIGAAFGKIVTSLVDNLVTPLVGIFMGGVDFTELSYTVGEAVFGYGAFIQSVIDFTIVAFVIFMVIRAINKAKGPEEEKEAAPAGPTEVELLMEIRDTLKR
jgi:large conductance mechanosensitive channel